MVGGGAHSHGGITRGVAPSIVNLREVFEDDNYVYMVMDLCVPAPPPQWPRGARETTGISGST